MEINVTSSSTKPLRPLSKAGRQRLKDREPDLHWQTWGWKIQFKPDNKNNRASERLSDLVFPMKMECHGDKILLEGRLREYQLTSLRLSTILTMYDAGNRTQTANDVKISHSAQQLYAHCLFLRSTALFWWCHQPRLKVSHHLLLWLGPFSCVKFTMALDVSGP